MKNETITRIAKKISAGVISSDYDEEFDAKAFAQGFKVKIDKAIETFINGFATKGTDYKDDFFEGVIPAILIGHTDKKTYADGRYTAVFYVMYKNDSTEEDGENALKFSMLTEVYKDRKQIWHDLSQYTIHITALAGESVKLKKFNNGFIVDQIGNAAIGLFMNGSMVIDQFGIGNAPADGSMKEQLKTDNFKFLKEKMDELVEKMVHRIQNWEKSNKVVETIVADVERKISDDSKKIQ